MPDTDFASQPWPRPAVSTAVFREGRVLLVKRAKPPLAELWSLPGGHIAPGESLADAALREVREETGVTPRLIGVTDAVEVILRHDDGGLRAHYVITVFAAEWLSGDGVRADDVSEVTWAAPETLGDLATTPGIENAVKRACDVWLAGRDASRPR